MANAHVGTWIARPGETVANVMRRSGDPLRRLAERLRRRAAAMLVSAEQQELAADLTGDERHRAEASRLRRQAAEAQLESYRMEAQATGADLEEVRRG